MTAKTVPTPAASAQDAIRVERRPPFWEGVASHPALAGMLMGIEPAVVGAIATRPDVLPLAAKHGGFMFRGMDPLGLVCELHTLFTPEGWGREALTAGIAAIELVWLRGCELVVTYEVEANPRSRPPRTFGFARCGAWQATPFGNLRLWILTWAAWEASPAARRRDKTCP